MVLSEFVQDARQLRRRSVLTPGELARADHMAAFEILDRDARSLRADGWEADVIQRYAEIAWRAAMSDLREGTTR